jgi:hypothetical protein
VPTHASLGLAMAAKAITNIFGGRFAAGMLLALTACNSKTTVKPVGAAKSVVDVVSSQTGFHPTDVSCPSGVEA